MKFEAKASATSRLIADDQPEEHRELAHLGRETMILVNYYDDRKHYAANTPFFRDVLPWS